MLDELLGKAKEAGFSIKELVCNKNFTTNTTFCRYFPEGMISYCSNHSTKNMHKALEKIKKYKCEVTDNFRCKRMKDVALNACKISQAPSLLPIKSKRQKTLCRLFRRA